MTTHKGFKRVVRARMAKTGERYAAARRALLAETDMQAAARAATSIESPGGRNGYQLRGGRFPNSAAIAAILANRGFVAGHTDRPLSEAMVFGIGGGLGAGYILWEFKARGGAILTLGFTNQWQYPRIPGWFGKTLDRLGVRAALHETAGGKSAQVTLDEILDAGEPVVTFVDQQVIGTWGQPDALSGYSGYPVVTCGRTDGGYLVDDRGRAPLAVTTEVMARARARIGSYRHRLIRLQPEAPAIDADALRAAVRAGLANQVEHLTAPSDSFSLPAWHKWARLMTDTRNAKAWPRVFAEGHGLFGALLSIVEGVDGDVGAEGGHLRYLYAEFLDEAASLLERPALARAAAEWRAVGDHWENFADAAVPADVVELADAVEAAEALHQAVMEGEPGRRAANKAARALWSIRGTSAEAFPASADRVAELFADLGSRLAAIHAAERQAITLTSEAIRP